MRKIIAIPFDQVDKDFIRYLESHGIIASERDFTYLTHDPLALCKYITIDHQVSYFGSLSPFQFKEEVVLFSKESVLKLGIHNLISLLDKSTEQLYPQVDDLLILRLNAFLINELKRSNVKT